jgi:hypothetical protein
MKKCFLLLLLTLTAALLSTGSLLAQRNIGAPPQVPGAPVDNSTNVPTDVPFDGGLSLVAAAGIAYAAKKGYHKRKLKNKA